VNPKGDDFALVGTGLTATRATWPGNVSFSINYDAEAGQSNFTANTVDGGVRTDF